MKKRFFAMVMGAFALIITALGPILPAAPAFAGATIVADPGGVNGPIQAGQQIVCDFDTTCLGRVTGNYRFATGTSPTAAAPGGTNITQYLVVPGTGNSGEAFLDFRWVGAVSSISFDWGSIEASNAVSFYLDSGPTLTINGFDLLSSEFGDQMSANANRRFNITFDDFQTVYKIGLRTGQIALEVDRFAVTPGGVPEPASWAMLIAGFGLVGMQMRRRAANDNGSMQRVAA